MKMTFVSKSGSLEYRQMNSKSDNSEIMSGFDKDKVIEQLFDCLCGGITYVYNKP